MLLECAFTFKLFFLGQTLAAPIGPVNSARIDKGIKNGFVMLGLLGQVP